MENGEIIMKMDRTRNYKNGKKNGKQKSYYANGKLKSISKWNLKNGKIKCFECGKQKNNVPIVVLK